MLFYCTRQINLKQLTTVSILQGRDNFLQEPLEVNEEIDFLGDFHSRDQRHVNQLPNDASGRGCLQRII